MEIIHHGSFHFQLSGQTTWTEIVRSRRTSRLLIGLYLQNYAANLTGSVIVALLNTFTPLEVFRDWHAFMRQGGWVWLLVFIPLIFLLGNLIQFGAQRPVAAMLSTIDAAMDVDPALQEAAKRRLLNLAFIIAVVNLAMWIVTTGLFIPFLALIRSLKPATCLYLFFRGIMIGLIASFVAFFLIDSYGRRKLVPILFPDGKLAVVPRTFKISILRRIRVLFGVGTNAPMLLLVGTLSFALWEIDRTPIAAVQLGRDVLVFAVIIGLIFVTISLSLNFLVGHSILQPIREMMRLVKAIRRGDFNCKVRVVSNDELGVLGDGMNEMAEGLRERELLRHSLLLAKEVQQNLLPQSVPLAKGLDIAAVSRYCDETGGDYYDFIETGDHAQGSVGIVVGDVSGHGIPAALLMASVRAALRQRAASPGSIARIVSDVNRQLVRDVEESGRFMTLFYLAIDRCRRNLRWVRAGHEPAIFYDPATDAFEDLRGFGVALGVNEDFSYQEYQRDDLAEGQIIVLGTDGLWETTNSAGEMFGRQAIHGIIRDQASAGARDVLSACMDALTRFQQARPSEDDVTAVVIKITAD
jgi:sigma-B regulation protein RsbU (phosphoserine phosphatase)